MSKRSLTRPLIATIGLWFVTLVLAAFFLPVGISKMVLDPPSVTDFHNLGYPVWFLFFIGVVEAGGALLLLIPRFAFSGAALLIVEMLGAIGTVGFLHPNYGRAITSACVIVLCLLIAWGRWPQFAGRSLLRRDIHKEQREV